MRGDSGNGSERRKHLKHKKHETHLQMIIVLLTAENAEEIVQNITAKYKSSSGQWPAPGVREQSRTCSAWRVLFFRFHLVCHSSLASLRQHGASLFGKATVKAKACFSVGDNGLVSSSEGRRRVEIMAAAQRQYII